MRHRRASGRRLVATAVARRGGLEILVNNAGPFSATPHLEPTASTWDLVWRANATATYLGAG